MANAPKLMFQNQDLPEATESYIIQTYEDKWRKTNKFKIEVYFDTNDIVRMIQGILGLWSNPSNTLAPPNINLFDSNDTLVHSLAFAKKLGTIKMLAPHQDELGLKIHESPHLFPGHFDPKSLENDLMHKLGLLILDNSSNTNSSIEELEKQLHSIRSEKALEWYKAKDLLRMPHWHKRYKYLVDEQKILQLDDTAYNLSGIIKSKNFEIYETALNKYRNTGKTRNNFTDAIAFCLLTEKLQQFKSDPTKYPLPIFFVNGAGTLNALKEVRRLNPELLTYRHEGSPPFPIFRDAEFFICDAVFNEDDEKAPQHNLFVELKTLIHTETENYRIIKEVLGKDNFEEIRNNLDKLVKDLFFGKIWFLHNGYTEITEALRQNKQYDAADEKQRKVSREEREELTLGLKKGADRIKIINTVWKELENIKEVIDSKFRSTNGIDVITDLGAVRFSFTKDCIVEIQRISSVLLDKQEGEDFKYCVAEVVSKIVDNINHREKHSDLAVGLAVLWVFDKWKLVTDIAERLDQDYENYQIPLLFAASIPHSGNHKPARAKDIAACISSKFVESKVPGFKPNYKVWVGLSYIYWQIWDNLNNRPSLPEQMSVQTHENFRSEPSFTYIKQAISLCLKTIKFLNKIRNENEEKITPRNLLYYYSVNLYIYLIVITGKAEEVKAPEMQNYVAELDNIAGTPAYWQNRFKDTIARYYLRLALIEWEKGEVKGFNTYLKFAKDSIGDCVRNSKIREVFYETLERNIKTIDLEYNKLAS